MFWARWLRLSRPSFRLASAPAFFSCVPGGSCRRFVMHGAWFDSSRRFSGFCGSPRGFYWLFDNFIGYGVKMASRGFCAVAPMAAYRRGLIQVFIWRFKRLLWLRGYLFGYSVKMPLWGF